MPYILTQYVLIKKGGDKQKKCYWEKLFEIYFGDVDKCLNQIGGEKFDI